MQRLRKFIYQLYAFTFFDQLVFLYPVYALMFKDYGISDTNISFLLMFWCFTITFIQIPTGVLSDKYPRKSILILGQFFQAGGLALWMLFPNFWGFLSGFFLWGAYWSISAVAEAYLYDELKFFRMGKSYVKVSGRRRAIRMAGSIVACLGSFMLFLGYEIISYLSIAAILVSIFFMMLTKPRAKSEGERKKLADILVESMRFMKNNPRSFFIVLILAIVMGLAYIDEYFGLIGVEMGFKKEYVGIIFIAVMLAESAGGLFAYRLERYPDNFLYMGVVLLGIVFATVFFFYSPFGVIILTAFYFLYSMLRIALFSRYQHSIASVSRGTLVAFMSFLEQFTSLVSYGVMVLAAVMGSYSFGFLILGGLVALSGILYLTAFTEKTT